MPDLAPSSPFLTVHEIAGLLRVTRWTVYEFVRTRDPIPCLKLGKRLLFDRDEVLRWARETRRWDGQARRLQRRARPIKRRRRVPAEGRVAAPHTLSGGQRANKPVRMRPPAGGPAPVALRAPSEDTMG